MQHAADCVIMYLIISAELSVVLESMQLTACELVSDNVACW